MRSMSYVSKAYLPRCFRMDHVHVCVTYVRRIGPATYMILIFKYTHKKRSASAYEEYELRIKEYELHMLTYVLRTRDAPFVS